MSHARSRPCSVSGSIAALVAVEEVATVARIRTRLARQGWWN
jgi:hypothetical protein